MDTTYKSVHPLTVGEVMDRNLVVAPRQMLVREAVRLLNRARANEAIVVDERGCCVGMLSPADVFRWVEAGSPDSVIDPVLTCPYQVRGRLLTGGEAVICVLAHGNCPYQVEVPTIGGRHTDVCVRQGNEQSPFGTVPSYKKTDVVTIGHQAPLHEVEQRMVDTRVDRIVVIDELDRPIGIVSATDILNVIANSRDGDRGSSDSAEVGPTPVQDEKA